MDGFRKRVKSKQFEWRTSHGRRMDKRFWMGAALAATGFAWVFGCPLGNFMLIMAALVAGLFWSALYLSLGASPFH